VAGRKVFTSGEILTAADVNSFLMDQSVMVFADSSARSSAIPTPSEGMVTYVEDANRVEVYDGAAFGPIGGILQVVQGVKTNVFSASTSTSYTAITGLSASITPSSASSKVLVMANVQGSTTLGSNNQAQLRQLRDATVIHVGDSAGSRGQTSGSYSARNSSNFPTFTTSWSVLDEPATTSSVTYSIEGRATSGTFYVNRSANDNDQNLYPRGVSSIILMEVAV